MATIVGSNSSPSTSIALGYALGGGSGWVLLTYVPRGGRLINQTLPSTRRRSRAGYQSSRSTCTRMRTTSTSAPTPRHTSIRSCATWIGRRWSCATKTRRKLPGRVRSNSRSSATSPASVWSFRPLATATMRITSVTLRNALGSTQSSRCCQIAFHQRRVSTRMARPMTPVATVASLAPNASAAKPMPMNPIGPVPMHKERMPSTRPRISAGALI